MMFPTCISNLMIIPTDTLGEDEEEEEQPEDELRGSRRFVSHKKSREGGRRSSDTYKRTSEDEETERYGVDRGKRKKNQKEENKMNASRRGTNKNGPDEFLDFREFLVGCSDNDEERRRNRRGSVGSSSSAYASIEDEDDEIHDRRSTQPFEIPGRRGRESTTTGGAASGLHRASIFGGPGEPQGPSMVQRGQRRRRSADDLTPLMSSSSPPWQPQYVRGNEEKERHGGDHYHGVYQSSNPLSGGGRTERGMKTAAHSGHSFILIPSKNLTKVAVCHEKFRKGVPAAHVSEEWRCRRLSIRFSLRD